MIKDTSGDKFTHAGENGSKSKNGQDQLEQSKEHCSNGSLWNLEKWYLTVQ